MQLTVLGTGCPIPDSERAQAGYLLEKAGKLLLVDCGAGIFHRLARLGVNWSKLDTFLITHHHLDHMSDLLPILTGRWLMGFPKATVYGPVGTETLVKAWVALYPYVQDFISIDAYDIPAGHNASIAGFSIQTLAMQHHVTSLAYKFDDALIICGDSEPLPSLKDFARNSKLLIHECSYLDGHEPNGHATPGALGRVLAGSNVQKILLTHFYPEAAERTTELIKIISRYFSGQIEIARELQKYEF
jgi:ribonuclease BN (tRNA processing enzyme)